MKVSRLLLRSPHAPLLPSHVTLLRSIVGASHVLASSEDAFPLARYSRDWLGQSGVPAAAVVRPASTAEVAATVRCCAENNLALVPQGGNTSLVGGSVPDAPGTVVLSLERLRRVISFDETSGVLELEAGVILAEAEAAAHAHGWTVPLDLGAKGSCHIGGNVSTNAGGLRLCRFGSLHGSVLGLTVVTGDGQTLDLMNVLRKDNMGVHLKHLFIGSEGSLGIVTEVAVQTAPRPSAVHVAMLGVDAWPAALGVVRAARQHLGEIVSAIEVLDRGSLELSVARAGAGGAAGADAVPPSLRSSPFALLVETSGSNARHDREKLDTFLEALLTSGTVHDGIVAQDSRQADALWKLREGAPVAMAERGYDFSFPIADMYDIVDIMRGRLAGWTASHDVRVLGFGHIADGNIHLNVSTRDKWPVNAAGERDLNSYHEAVRSALEPFVYDWTIERKGSISAEHGVGRAKPKWLERVRSPQVMDFARQLKRICDPAGILNPGAVFAHDAR